jgi:hypothetical protein
MIASTSVQSITDVKLSSDWHSRNKYSCIVYIQAYGRLENSVQPAIGISGASGASDNYRFENH